NQSSDRFVVQPGGGEGGGTIGVIRVPLTAIRGLGPEAAQHILAVRAAFGQFINLLDFCRKVDRRLVSRHDVLLLIKLGAMSFTGLGRAQLAAAEQQYSALGDAVRAAEGDPAGLLSLEDELAAGSIKLLPTAEWSPETIAAFERAHLGFLTASPLEVQKHA